MSLFLCKLWPYLAGALIGWLLAGWFARRLKHSTAPVEKIVEKHIDKVVDNPEHLALISKLEDENKKIPDLMNKIAGFESKGVRGKSSHSKTDSSSNTKTVEKIIDNPVHLKRIAELEGQLSSASNRQAIGLDAARAAGLKIKSDTDYTVIEGIGPQINELIHQDGIASFSELADSDVPRIQKILDDAGPRFKIANPGTWPDQAHLVANNRWSALKALQDVLDGGVYPSSTTTLKKSVTAKTEEKAKSETNTPKKAEVTKPDIKAAKAAGFRVRPKNDQDDFTVVEGIGPKINDLIHNDGIHTYAKLAKTKVEDVQKILDNAGARYRLAKPGTWPAQADMAANNKWEELKAWQDELDGGE